MAKVNIRIFKSEHTDPAVNMAFEEMLIKGCEENQVILYLWQNEPSLIMGRNQNPYVECNVSEVIKEGIHLLRRKSGGGTVYHDLGNLNYTFIAGSRLYDEDRHFRVIFKALDSQGVGAYLSDRKDLWTRGRKFSGSAFMHHKAVSCHHGTLLVDSDLLRLNRYLEKSDIHVKTRGVASVKSKVINLNECNPALTPRDLADSIIEAFTAIYGQDSRKEIIKPAACGQVDPRIVREYRDWQWNIGESPKATIRLDKVFSWGHLRLEVLVKNGRIHDLGEETEFIVNGEPEPNIEALKGVAFRASEISSVLSNLSLAPPEKEALRLFLEKSLI